MKTKLCKPVLVPASDKNDIYNLLLRPNGKVMKCFTGAEYRRMVLIGWVPMELDLISLDPDEKIEEGDTGYINIGGGTIGVISYDKEYKTWDLTTSNNIHYPFSTREYIKKVIATQSQLSPEYISKFVEEYNNGCVLDLEIEITNPTYDDWMENGASPVFPKPKLTNNYITIVEKGSIMYSEEECYRKLHNLMTDIKFNGIIINDDTDLKLWFNNNKKK